jgi:hypothetical protein
MLPEVLLSCHVIWDGALCLSVIKPIMPACLPVLQGLFLHVCTLCSEKSVFAGLVVCVQAVEHPFAVFDGSELLHATTLRLRGQLCSFSTP